MQVTAVDADDPMTDNAALSYSIIGQETVPPNSINKTMFGINNKTGVIYIRDVGLDRDVSSYFSIKQKWRTQTLIRLSEPSRTCDPVNSIHVCCVLRWCSPLS